MADLHLRYYPSQKGTQFVGDLIIGVNELQGRELTKALGSLEKRGKLAMEIGPMEHDEGPFAALQAIAYETFHSLECRFSGTMERIRLERKKGVLRIHLNPYTTQDLIDTLDKLEKNGSDYGLDMYELVSEEGEVKRASRRLWVVAV